MKYKTYVIIRILFYLIIYFLYIIYISWTNHFRKYTIKITSFLTRRRDQFKLDHGVSKYPYIEDHKIELIPKEPLEIW